MKYLILPVLFALVYGSSAHAESWGSRNSSSLGNDSFRSSNGAECSTNRETGRNLSFGTFGRDEGSGQFNQGVYVEYSMKLGQERSTINCSRLFEVEMKRQELEVERLRAELDLLKSQTQSTSDW